MKVGGTYAGALAVRVREAAVDGKANHAVVVAVADAFGLRSSQVRILHGRHGRSKLLEIDDPAGKAETTLERLKSGH